MAKKIFLTIFDTFVNAFLDFAHRNCEEKPAKNHDELHVVVAVEQLVLCLALNLVCM